MNILKNWIPYKINFQEEPITCEWLDFGDKTFIEPFFQETVALCKRNDINRRFFKSTSSLESLIEFSEGLNFVPPTAFIFHISRCGSTLLSQQLSLIETNVMVSEAPILDEILREISFKKNNIAGKLIDESLKAAIKFLGSKRSGTEENFVIKLDSWHILYHEKIRELFPDTPFICNFRRPDEVIRSQLQEPGMHAMRGVIQPEVFGFELSEILKLKHNEYIAQVIARYFEIFIELSDIDKNTLFLDYADGPITVFNNVICYLKLKVKKEELDEIIKRSQFHSKKPYQVFEEISLDGQIEAYQKAVFELYENLRVKSKLSN